MLYHVTLYVGKEDKCYTPEKKIDVIRSIVLDDKIVVVIWPAI